MLSCPVACSLLVFTSLVPTGLNVPPSDLQRQDAGGRGQGEGGLRVHGGFQVKGLREAVCRSPL